MTGIELVKDMSVQCGEFWSVERPGKDEDGHMTRASNGEMKRWLANGAVILNGEPLREKDEVTWIGSLVLFPKGARRMTLW